MGHSQSGGQCGSLSCPSDLSTPEQMNLKLKLLIAFESFPLKTFATALPLKRKRFACSHGTPSANQSPACSSEGEREAQTVAGDPGLALGMETFLAPCGPVIRDDRQGPDGVGAGKLGVHGLRLSPWLHP